MDERDNNRIYRTLQVRGRCNALWAQGQIDESTIYSFDPYNYCMGCGSLALDVQHKSTSKSEMQLQCKSSNEETRQPNRISRENAVVPYEQIKGNGEEENSSNHGKSHILCLEGGNQELLFRGINSWKERNNERRENPGIQNGRTSSGRESKNDEIYVFKCQKKGRIEKTSNERERRFKCPNKERIGRLRAILGPLLRVGTLVGTSWKEDYPKTPCYFVLPDSKPKWTIDASMSPLSDDNRFDLSGNNPTLLVEMIENESDRCRIAKSLNIEIQSVNLQKDYIYHDIMDISQCGFNHIIIIGSCYCGLLFLDCYERVFRWDAMIDVLLFFGNFSNVSEKPEKPCGVRWNVSLDGTVWELSDSDLPEESNSHPVNDEKKSKKSKKKGKNKNQKKCH